MKKLINKIIMTIICLGLFMQLSQLSYAELTQNLEFKDTPLRDAFRLVGKVFKVGILLDDSVDENEKITMALPDVTCEQALELMTRLKGLRYKRYYNFYIVGKEEALAANFDYTSTRVFHLNYVWAKDVAAEISGIVEERHIKADEVTNTIVVTGTELQLKNVKEIVEQLDIELPVIHFDVRIEELSSFASQTLGLDYNFDSFRIFNKTIAPNWFATLQALEQKGHAKVRARPNFSIINNKEGEFNVVSQIPFLAKTEETDQGIKKTYEYKDVGIKLNFKPRVNRAQDITVVINGELSNVGTYKLGELSSIDLRQIKSIIKVNDEETFVICGMLWEDSRIETSGVPLLSSLPLIGRVFRKEYEKKETKELVFFITPRIVQKNINLHDKSLSIAQPTTTIETKIPFDEEEAKVTKDEMQRRLEKLLKEANKPQNDEASAANGTIQNKQETIMDTKESISAEEEKAAPDLNLTVKEENESTETVAKEEIPAPETSSVNVSASGVPIKTEKSDDAAPEDKAQDMLIQTQDKSVNVQNNQIELPVSIEITPQNEKNNAGKIIYYTVMPEDTLYRISKKFGIKVEDIKKENNIGESNIITVGSILKIFIPASHIYIIKQGDTLYSIAKRYGITVASILAINEINDVTNIAVGTEIILPVKIE